jgi:hypothetical protein
MQSSRTGPSAASVRRFVLLPEEGLQQDERQPRIRRYELASVGPRGTSRAVLGASARIAPASELPGRV